MNDIIIASEDGNGESLFNVEERLELKPHSDGADGLVQHASITNWVIMNVI